MGKYSGQEINSMGLAILSVPTRAASITKDKRTVNFDSGPVFRLPGCQNRAPAIFCLPSIPKKSDKYNSMSEAV